ncbi:MAG: DinB family protein [Betaproteobacteria bacterium]
MTPAAARAMAPYNRWMNERLYECCAKIPDTERKRDVGAFFKSIHGTLNHLLLGDRIWMGRFTGKPFAATSLAQELHAGFDALRAEREALDGAIIAWPCILTDERLANDLEYTSVVNPKPRRYPLWFAVQHFFNHQTHHRGQLTTLLSQRSIDPGVTDLIWLPGYQQ